MAVATIWFPKTRRGARKRAKVLYRQWIDSCQESRAIFQRLAGQLRDAVSSYLDDPVKRPIEMKIKSRHDAAVDPHRSLSDQAARLAAGFREIQIHEQSANPNRLRRAELFANIARQGFVLVPCLEILARGLGGLGAMIARDQFGAGGFFELHRMGGGG